LVRSDTLATPLGLFKTRLYRAPTKKKKKFIFVYNTNDSTPVYSKEHNSSKHCHLQKKKFKLNCTHYITQKEYTHTI